VISIIDVNCTCAAHTVVSCLAAAAAVLLLLLLASETHILYHRAIDAGVHLFVHKLGAAHGPAAASM